MTTSHATPPHEPPRDPPRDPPHANPRENPDSPAGAPQDLPAAIDPVAAILAVIIPGAGQFYQGHKKRGILMCISILGLFFGGLLIGGIDVVDSKSDRLWFMGQILVGPIALVTDSIHQSRFKALDPVLNEIRTPLPDETIKDGKIAPAPAGTLPPMRKSLGKMNEIGTLYATIAGMLNLIIIIDAAFPSRPNQRRSKRPVVGGTR